MFFQEKIKTRLDHLVPSITRESMYVCKYVCMYGHTYSKSMDQPGKVASAARGQLNRGNEKFPVRVRT